MVSLENSRNAKGGFSFEQTSPINDDFIDSITPVPANTHDTLPLTTTVEPNYKQIGTTFGIVLQLFSVVLLLLSAFLIPHFCGDKNEKCPQLEFSGFDVVTIIHATTWFLKFIFDRFYHYHHMKMRRHGYLRFYRFTRLIRSLPLIIISAGNSLLVVLLKVIQKYCPDEKCPQVDLNANNILQIFVSLECALLIPILLYYLYLTVKFNKSKALPDISVELAKPAALSSQLKDVGARDATYVSSILENQADMIRYLQERNEKLSKKLLQISENSSTHQNIN